MDTITIAEIREKRVEAQKAIAEILTKLTTETGQTVCSIYADAPMVCRLQDDRPKCMGQYTVRLGFEPL